jgi:CHAT domain-containing protein
VESLYQIARAENRRGDLIRAQTFVEEGIKIAESIRAELGSTEFRSAYLASEAVQGSYRLYTDVLMRRHQTEPTKGFDALAVEVGERQRARSLLDLLTVANIDVREGVDPTLIERERAVAKQLNDKARKQTSTQEQAAALKQEISQLENDYERAQVAIRKASPHYAALTQPQPLKLSEIQAQLDANTLLLEYALGEDRSYLWAISKDSLKSYELPKEAEIRQSALSVQEMLTARSTARRGESALERQQRISQAEAQLPAAAQALSQTVLAPVAAELGNKRLVIVADGALQYIPFAMLPEPKPETGRQGEGASGRQGEVAVAASPHRPVAASPSRPVAPSPSRPVAVSPRLPLALTPLIVNHEIVSLPSASALAIQRTELAGRKPAPRTLAVIADPVFDRKDVRFNTAATEASDKEKFLAIGFEGQRTIEHLAEKTNDKAGTITQRLVIPRLPFTRQEATRLLALTPKSSSFQAMDFQANRATVLKGDLAKYRYVHFATHGLLDAERPGLSSLVLSMVDAQGNPQDGFLRGNDIYNLKLPAELVVLSACQTGLGKEIKGEGLVGLTRGFMYAGAARVVVSLWSVNDKATAELMTRFYEKMLKSGARPAAALRAAQVEMWRQKQWQSPYYWAAFTLQGEWR